MVSQTSREEVTTSETVSDWRREHNQTATIEHVDGSAKVANNSTMADHDRVAVDEIVKDIDAKMSKRENASAPEEINIISDETLISQSDTSSTDTYLPSILKVFTAKILSHTGID